MFQSTIQSGERGLEDTFRQALRRVAGTVCLVTASDESARWYGITVTSVVSVSMSPPSLLACVNRASTVFDPIDRRGAFCVNILSQEHEQHSVRFSSPADYETRFKVGDWQSHAGLPYLADAQAAVFCDVAQKIFHGSHGVFIGNVTDVITPSDIRAPLIYFNRGYLTRESSTDFASRPGDA